MFDINFIPTYNILMETKTKTLSILVGVVIAVIAIWLGIRFLGWAIRALLFGGGGLVIGFIIGAIWMNKRNKLKGTAGRNPAAGTDI